MNCLQIRLELLADPSVISEYLSRLDALGCDAACCVIDPVCFYSDPECFTGLCARFAAEAHDRSFVVCTVVLTSRAPAGRLGVEEAQYDEADRVIEAGGGAFRPSPASAAWQQMLGSLVDALAGECGFDWIAIEEPAYAAALPGGSDRVRGLFVSEYPDTPYPTANEETAEYLKLQQVKAESVLRFCTDLVQRAVKAGAGKVGIMPQVFIAAPCSAGVPRTACEIARLAQIPGVSFLVSRMTADETGGRAATSADGAAMPPEVFYLEVLAHSVGKPVMCVMDPAIAKKPDGQVDLSFLRDRVCAVLAAGASGYAAGYREPEPHGPGEWAEVLFEAGQYAGRMAMVTAQAAFVVSTSGATHLPPNDYHSISSRYLQFMKHMALKEHVPILTFSASTLRQNLAEYPEVRLLIMEEHNPLSVEEMTAIRDWWSGRERRGILVFCSGEGVAADTGSPGTCLCSSSLPGVLELIGLRQDPDEPVFAPEAGVTLRDVSRVRRSAFLRDAPPVRLRRVANVRRAFGSRALLLYDVDGSDEPIPVVAEYRDRGMFAVFCGFGLNEDTLAAAASAVRYVLREVDAEPPVIAECSEGLIWNTNRSGYLVFSNATDKALTAAARRSASQFWDCREGRMLPEGDIVFTVEPHSYQLYRIVTRRSKLLDVIGVSSLRSLMEGAGKAEMEIVAGRETTAVVRVPPKEVLVDGKHVAVTQRAANGVYHITLGQCPPGDHRITFRW